MKLIYFIGVHAQINLHVPHGFRLWIGSYQQFRNICLQKFHSTYDSYIYSGFQIASNSQLLFGLKFTNDSYIYSAYH